MDDVLPSYETATSNDVCGLIAPYLCRQEVLSAALVCRKWHASFTKQLWCNPASHFDIQSDDVYKALATFKDALQWTRKDIRKYTHTLQFPAAHFEAYDSPHSDWLRDCLEKLPNLQCLTVDGLPFFDHAALSNLKTRSVWWLRHHADSFPNFGLRLLDASGCMNVTATGLTEALQHLPELIVLNLSKTPAAKDRAVLGAFRGLQNLRVLGIAKLGLTDSDLSTVASAIGRRVRSIDLGQNYLTDSSVRCLIEHCFETKDQQIDVVQHNSHMSNHLSHHERQQEPLEDFEGTARATLAQGSVVTLLHKGEIELGITHLFLSGNRVTVRGATELIRWQRFQTLDIGALWSSLPLPVHSPSILNGAANPESVAMLVQKLDQHASRDLLRLRIDYRVVTGEIDNGGHALKSGERWLQPGMLPKLRTLVLVGVPPRTGGPKIIQRLIQYIEGCANEATRAKTCAKQSYEHPPGRNRQLAEEQYAQGVFALRQITLEMALSHFTVPDRKLAQETHITRSLTEDVDTERLWEAAKQDFSFFEKDSNINIQRKTVPHMATHRAQLGDWQPEKAIDILDELGKFRKSKRAAFMEAQQYDENAPVEGHWLGQLTVVRSGGATLKRSWN